MRLKLCHWGSSAGVALIDKFIRWARNVSQVDSVISSEGLKHMNNDQVSGKVDEVKGKIKEQWGKVTNDPKTQAKGLADQVKGKGEQTFGDVKETIKKTDEDLDADLDKP
jgi:uncharacterized protein YjbJ (UPF0337 family)